MKTKEQPAARFFLEAHYFDGGLRIRELAADRRPQWAPPAGRVGLRSDLTLREGEFAVEHCRLLHAERPVSWLALYRKSVDRLHGDRQNYAGIGVWVDGGRIIDPLTLLRGFLKFVGEVDGRTLPSLEKIAQSFGEQVVPRCVAPPAAMPEELGGWPFAPSLPDSGLFVASAADTPDAFRDAADQVSRMAVFADPAQRSRAVIFVPRTSDAASRAPEGAEALPRDLTVQMLSELPNLIRQTGDQLERVRSDLRSASDGRTELEQRARAAEAEVERLRADVAERNAAATRTPVTRREFGRREVTESDAGSGAILKAIADVDYKIGTVETISKELLELAQGKRVKPYKWGKWGGLSEDRTNFTAQPASNLMYNIRVFSERNLAILILILYASLFTVGWKVTNRLIEAYLTPNATETVGGTAADAGVPTDPATKALSYPTAPTEENLAAYLREAVNRVDPNASFGVPGVVVLPSPGNGSPPPTDTLKDALKDQLPRTVTAIASTGTADSLLQTIKAAFQDIPDASLQGIRIYVAAPGALNEQLETAIRPTGATFQLLDTGTPIPPSKD